MRDALLTISVIGFGGLFLALVGAYIALHRRLIAREKEVVHEREESQRRLYEIAILKEVGERAGYSLDVEEILRIITGSLRQLIPYSVTSYAVMQGDTFKLSTYLEESVAPSFLTEMKVRMAASLEAILDTPVASQHFIEVVSGAITLEEATDAKVIGSYFNVPLTVSGKLAGLLTIAHTKKGLYKEADMTILYKITAQASNAVTRLEEVVRVEEEKLMKVREEYTSMIVHELRSPLDGMKKIVELLISGSIKTDTAQFKEYTDLLYQSASSTLELVNDILDYSKIQAGKFEITPGPGDIRAVFDNRIAFYKVLAETKGITLTSLVEESVPRQIPFDERAIKQVLNNFISNSLKFTPRGGRVTLAAAEEEHSVRISVSDTGVGIPKDKIKMLFTAYMQTGKNPIDPESKSTGLGLLIAQGIVDAHKGKINVVSKEGEGSTFSFAIPLK